MTTPTTTSQVTVIYYTVCADGTFWKATHNLVTGQEQLQQITMNQFLDAQNELQIDLSEWE